MKLLKKRLRAGTNTRRAMLAVVAVALSLGAPGAHAANAVDVEVTSKIPIGGAPKVTIHVHQELAKATLALKDKDGAVVRVSGGPAKVGADVVLSLPPVKVAGVRAYSGTLDVRFVDGSGGSMPLSFSVEGMAVLGIEAVTPRLKLSDHELVVRATRDVVRVDVEVTGDDGTLIANQSVTFENAKAGTDLVVKWTPKSDAVVLKIAVVAHDAEGFFSPTLLLHPWSLTIPHDEVVFATGQSEILPDEFPKLEAVLPEIRTAIGRYGKVVEVKLYVAGHTDTVGAAANNLELSRRRADTIARWFRARGVSVKILARGFGETMLKVDTDDEVDNVANRRVDYVLAVESPTGDAKGWHKVP